MHQNVGRGPGQVRKRWIKLPVLKFRADFMDMQNHQNWPMACYSSSAKEGEEKKTVLFLPSLILLFNACFCFCCALSNISSQAISTIFQRCSISYSDQVQYMGSLSRDQLLPIASKASINRQSRCLIPVYPTTLHWPTNSGIQNAILPDTEWEPWEEVAGARGK